jgi:hypothetical protein
MTKLVSKLVSNKPRAKRASQVKRVSGAGDASVGPFLAYIRFHSAMDAIV